MRSVLGRQARWLPLGRWGKGIAKLVGHHWGGKLFVNHWSGKVIGTPRSRAQKATVARAGGDVPTWPGSLRGQHARRYFASTQSTVPSASPLANFSYTRHVTKSWVLRTCLFDAHRWGTMTGKLEQHRRTTLWEILF